MQKRFVMQIHKIIDPMKIFEKYPSIFILNHDLIKLFKYNL